MPEPETIQLFRALRGAPATILLLLLMRQVSMTNLEIQMTTGLSDRTVTKSLATLDALGYTQHNGRHHGWSIRQGSQLRLPFREQLDGSYPQPVDNKIVNSTIYALTTTTTIDSLDLALESMSSSSRSRGKDRKIYDLPQDGPDSGTAGDPDVAYWLRRAGVGPTSRKYRQLLAAGLDPETVRAHALERLAKPDLVPVGLLIVRLLDGDPAPAPRCPECYLPLDSFGRCTGPFCDYIDDPDAEED